MTNHNDRRGHNAVKGKQGFQKIAKDEPAYRSLTAETPADPVTLSEGAHDPGDVKAFVTEWAKWLADEERSDHPAYTHPVLATVARDVNDRLPDNERQVLVPLLGRLYGTSDAHLPEHERQVLSARLVRWAARQVTEEGTPVRAAIEAAEGRCDETANVGQVRTAASSVYTSAYAYAVGRYNDLPGLLTGLIDEYDRLTGRTEHTRLDDAALADLRERVEVMGGAE